MYLCLSADTSCFFFFNDTATTEIYTLSLHDALPIFSWPVEYGGPGLPRAYELEFPRLERAFVTPRPHEAVTISLRIAAPTVLDRKSTRLNSSHANISYAVFCLEKKQRGYDQDCTPPE